ncbi:MAG: hypothetical protein AAF616_00525 [Bacteroidota bacterium]
MSIKTGVRCITYILLSLTLCAGLAADKLSDLVVPIDWTRFKDAIQSSEYTLSSKLVANGARYSFNWAENYYEISPDGSHYLIENVNKEQPIRTPSSAAMGLAVAIKTKVDETSIGASYKDLTKCAIQLVKGVVMHHKANGGKWGDHWQSTMWAAQAGRAGWMLWESLDDETKEMICKMVIYEADRHIKPSYQIKYWNGEGGNSRAEENSWDSMPLQLAIAMMPSHPNVQAWKNISSKLLVSAYSIKNDMNRKKPKIDGKSPSEWLDGYNVREDGIVINHGLLHNDYMSSIAHLQMSGFMVFSLANQIVPQALDFNFRLIYKTLVTKQFESPPYVEPGGTMYIAGSPEQYYPQGTDWSQYRYACYYGMDALTDVLEYDKKLPKASNWVKLRGERILELQSRHEDGRMYKPGEYDNYWGKEQMCFWMFADAHLLYWLADRNALSKQKNWLKKQF